MDAVAVEAELEAHIRRNHGDRFISVLYDEPGAPVYKRVPRFRVVEVPPAEPGLWAYFSIGAWEVTAPEGRAIEFVAITGRRELSMIRHLAMAAYYHANPDDESYRLDLGHTVPIGEPWLPESTLDVELVARPYPLEHDVWHCNVGDLLVDYLWLQPITDAERQFRHDAGLEALEQRFEEQEIDVVDPRRASVV